MFLQRWDPYGEFHRMDELMNRAWRGFARGNGHALAARTWSIPLDVEHDGDSVVISASLPGVKPDDIKVTIDGDVLSIRAETGQSAERKEDGYLVHERRAGAFYRALRLPETVDREKVESRYEDGVLKVTLPQLEASKPKQIEVKAA